MPRCSTRVSRAAAEPIAAKNTLSSAPQSREKSQRRSIRRQNVERGSDASTDIEPDVEIQKSEVPPTPSAPQSCGKSRTSVRRLNGERNSDALSDIGNFAQDVLNIKPSHLTVVKQNFNVLMEQFV